MARDDGQRKVRAIMFGVGDFDNIDTESAAGAEIDFSVGFDEMYERAVATAREHKEEATTNGPVDLIDQCVAVLPVGSFNCPIRELCDGIGINPPEAIAISMKGLRETIGQPIAVLTLIETVFRVQQDGHRPERGEIADAWHAGTDVNIKEALTVVVATPVRVAVEFMPYHYGDGSIVWDTGNRWDDSEDWPNLEVDDGIGVIEAIRTAFMTEEEQMDLSDHELELIARDIGTAITALVQKAKRTGQDGEKTEHQALLSRILQEQVKRGRASA